jgi:hypothetical protein
MSSRLAWGEIGLVGLDARVRASIAGPHMHIGVSIHLNER